MDCPTPAAAHDCQHTWRCTHGLLFTRHAPDGQVTFGSESCPDCKAECAEATNQLEGSGLIERFAAALMRHERED